MLDLQLLLSLPVRRETSPNPVDEFWASLDRGAKQVLATVKTIVKFEGSFITEGDIEDSFQRWIKRAKNPRPDCRRLRHYAVGFVRELRKLAPQGEPQRLRGASWM